MNDDELMIVIKRSWMKEACMHVWLWRCCIHILQIWGKKQYIILHY